MTPLYERVYAIVGQVPRGRVSTYGQIAGYAGCSPRQVGYAMAALPPNSDVPWQRVVNRLGALSVRTHGDGQAEQRDLLQQEGLSFRNDRIDLKRALWTGPDRHDLPEGLEDLPLVARRPRP